MTTTFFLDTVTGALMTSRLVLGIVLAGAVILLEALVLYKLGWAVNMTASLVESTATTASVQNPSKQFLPCLRDSFLANFASTVVGWFVAQYLLFLYFWSISFWVTAFVITIVVETFMLWILRRGQVGRSLLVALAMNATSYFVLIVILGLIYELGLASRF